MQRTILHSDLNSFYASVEVMLDPSLRDKPVAVCGSTESRHGIVLAKSEQAKRAGVKTGMVNWEAKQWAPNLIIVKPQYDQYIKYSACAREIYSRYTYQVEPYGMDECWIDVTGSAVGDGEKIAEEIRQTMREELGLTVSIGVSFNKVFAKLGSDMKKPDATTVITPDDYKRKVWTLPASDLLFVGPATTKKLAGRGIRTIGDLAQANLGMLRSLLGVNGEYLWLYANGQDQGKVMPCDFVSPVKSIGHGTTCISDLESNEEVWQVMLELAQDVAHRLRVHQMVACGVQIAIRDKNLWVKQYQFVLPTATRSALDIAHSAFDLFCRSYRIQCGIRSVTIRAIRLAPQTTPQQTLLFEDIVKKEKLDRIDSAVEDIRRRFGKNAVRPASLIAGSKCGAAPMDGIKPPSPIPAS